MSIEEYAKAAKRKKDAKKKKNKKETKMYFSNKEEVKLEPEIETKTVITELVTPKKRTRKKKNTIEIETDGTHSPRKRAARGSKPLKQYFTKEDYHYNASKIVYRILNNDGSYTDEIKEYDLEIRFNANGKIDSKTIYKDKKYRITDMITNESYLTFVIEPYFEKID